MWCNGCSRTARTVRQQLMRSQESSFGSRCDFAVSSKLKRGSMANISKYIDGDWGASTVHGEAASTVVGIANALVAFDAFFTSKYANQMGANPTIQCNGHTVHFVVKQGVGR